MSNAISVQAALWVYLAKQAAREFNYSEKDEHRLTDGDAICSHN